MVDVAPCDVSKFDDDDWNFAESLMKKVTDKFADMNVDRISQDVECGDAQLWALTVEEDWVGVMVTRFLEYPSGYYVMMLQLAATGGGVMEHENMRAVVGILEGIAREMGCDAMRIVGRKGWARIFTEYIEVERTFDKVLRQGD